LNLPPHKLERILLVFPAVINSKAGTKACVLPIGIASLAAFVRDKIEVKVLDAVLEGHDHEEEFGDRLIRFGLSDREIINRVEEFKPHLIGFSCIFSHQFPLIRRLVDQVKKLDPSIIAVVGGSHPSMLPERALGTTQLDYVVIGEGELAFSRLIDALRSGGPLEGIPGLAFRENNGVHVNGEPELIKDLDQLPFPARNLFDVEKYFRINMPMQTLSRSPRNLGVSFSRGCPYYCGFCCSTIHWGHKYRTRSSERFLDELESLKTEFGTEEIKFQDDNLTFNKGRARQLFQGMIDRKLDLMWNAPNGISPWTLDAELLELMKASGCYELSLAIESGDPGILRNIVKKPVDLDQTREIVKQMKKIGIETGAFFIIGFPGETREQMENTINFARSLDIDRCQLLLFTPLPGTPLAKLAIEQGRIRPDYDFEDEGNYLFSRFHISEVPPEELRRIHRRGFWSINLAFLYKHPFKFFEKYRASLASHPEFIIKFFRSLRL